MKEPSPLPVCCGDERSVRIVEGKRRVVREALGGRGDVKKTIRNRLGGREEGRMGRVEKSVVVEVGGGGKKTINMGGGSELIGKGGGKEGRSGGRKVVVAGGKKRSRLERDGKTAVEKGSVKEVTESVDNSGHGALVDISRHEALVDISGHEALVEAVRRHGEKVDTLRRRGRAK